MLLMNLSNLPPILHRFREMASHFRRQEVVPLSNALVGGETINSGWE